jgi:S1-C subfamily serine protease/rhodanese-related sulfurtransferase
MVVFVGMKALVAAGALLAVWFGVPAGVRALTVQEAILFTKPGVALVTAEVRAEVTMKCAKIPVTVSPAPFVETGTGWFVDGRGFLITNAHVVDPAHRVLPWVVHELKKKAIEQACVEPALRARGLVRGERPDLEERIRQEATERALASAQVTPQPQISVMLSNGVKLMAEVKKFSAPVLLDRNGRPVSDSGRDLALLRVKDGVYPTLSIADSAAKLGDPVHILGFPGVVLSHELLSQSVAREASFTNGSVSGFDVDAIGQDVIQTDAPATHGTSGGPAIGADARVLGVMTFTSLSSGGGAIVQGYNFLIPARDVRAFLQGTEVTKPGESEFNTAWRAGLDALFKERYAVAVARLTEANKFLPDLADVKRQLAEAEAKAKNPPPRPFPWAWATVGVTFVSLGAYGGMFGRRWWQNRFRIQPTQVIGLIERGVNPIMVDARTKSDFETSPLKLPGAIRLDPVEAEAGHFNLDIQPDRVIVTYDTTPGEVTSARVSQILRARGWKNVRILKGGLGSWTNARLPVETKGHMPAIGLEIYTSLTLGDVERRRFKAGDVIFRQGDDAREEAYVVHEGSVEIRKSVDGEARVLGHHKEGDLFGELALFRKAPRSADAVAVTDVELLIIQNERLDWLIRNRPALTIELLRRLSEWVVMSDRDRAAAQTR